MTAPKKAPLKFGYYKSNVGMFVESFLGYQKTYTDWKVNGVPFAEIAIPTSTDKFFLLHGVFEITSIDRRVTPGRQLAAYRLRNMSLEGPAFPSSLTPEQVGEYYCADDEQKKWKNYDDIRPMYEPIYMTPEPYWEPQEIEANLIRELQIDSYNDPIKMEVTTFSNGLYSAGQRTVDLASIVCYDDLERMLTPEFLLHERPCSLSSEQVYKIIRHHIRTNIDSKYARITSDYDFCFTVKRKVAVKPYKHTTVKKTGPSGRKLTRPQYTTHTIEHKEIEVFAMTYSPYNYSGYVAVNGWKANSLEEMAEQVRTYLADLTNEINAAVQECPVCSGTGHTPREKIETNAR